MYTVTHENARNPYVGVAWFCSLAPARTYARRCAKRKHFVYAYVQNQEKRVEAAWGDVCIPDADFVPGGGYEQIADPATAAVEG